MPYYTRNTDFGLKQEMNSCFLFEICELHSTFDVKVTIAIGFYRIRTAIDDKLLLVCYLPLLNHHYMKDNNKHSTQVNKPIVAHFMDKDLWHL